MLGFSLVYRDYELSDDEFAQLFTHEVSHHLGLPDRYPSDSCTRRET
jgi:hypothetical protein